MKQCLKYENIYSPQGPQAQVLLTTRPGDRDVSSVAADECISSLLGDTNEL